MKCKLLSVLTLAFQLWTIGVMAGDRPNILFLFADDQRADTIAALGNSHIQTPNLDRLVRRGLAFDRAYMQGGLNGEMTIRDEALLRWPRQPEKIREMIAEYYRYVSYLDAEIGRVLDALEASPHAKNTIVVFAADSGVARGSHGLIGKQNCYEHSLRVPLILSGPGIPQGQRTSEMCYLFDVLPTLGKLCDVPGPTTSEGIEFTVTVKAPTHAARPQLVLGYKSVQRAIRDDRWKLIRYPHIDKTQLFDLQTDPHEITNLADKPEHAAKVADLMTRLEQDLTAFGDKHPLKVANPEPAEWSPPVTEGRLKNGSRTRKNRP